MFDITDKLERKIEGLRSLKMSDEIDGYQAEENIDNAIAELEAALEDIETAREN